MATEVEALIAGTMWKVEKAVGDAVEAFDVIMILESMKMEIPVEAPVAGTLVELRVKVEDPVVEDQVIAIVESAG